MKFLEVPIIRKYQVNNAKFCVEFRKVQNNIKYQLENHQVLTKKWKAVCEIHKSAPKCKVLNIDPVSTPYTNIVVSHAAKTIRFSYCCACMVELEYEVHDPGIATN